MRTAMHKHKVRSVLVARGTSYAAWAAEHGYNPRTVTQSVARWAGRSELPRGLKTYRILRELSAFIGKEIVPGVLQ